MSALESIAGGLFAFRLAWGLVHSLWEGLLIAGALAAARHLLLGRPAARHAAGWLALLLLAASVPATALLAPEPAAALADAGTRPAISPSMAVAPTVAGRPRTSPAGPSPRRAAGDQVVAEAPPRDRPPWNSAGSPATPDRWRFIRPSAPWIAGGWLAGATLLAAWRLGGWLRLGGLRRGATPASPDLQDALERVGRGLGIRRAVRLLESPRVRMPAAIGWIRPVVLAPVGMLSGLPIDQVELILAHELAHVRRTDFLANLVQTAIETLLFYHPAAWWISRTIRAEREACCDDLVVAATGERLSYGRALARLAEQCAEPHGAAPGGRLTMSAGGGDLLARVRRIVRPEPRRPLPQAVGGLAALAAAAGLTWSTLGLPVPWSAAATRNALPDVDRPQVVAVYPADGAVDVPSETEIRIRFDRPMSPTAARLAWFPGRGRGAYQSRGPLRYDAETYEFALPVRLTPGAEHKLKINEEIHASNVDTYMGFRAIDGPAVGFFLWSFTTAMPTPAPLPSGGTPPRIVHVDPPPETKVALLTPVEITFDRPMDPTSFGLSRPANGRGPGIRHASYDEEARRFTLLVDFPSNWYGECRPERFRSAEGVPAATMPLGYRTLDDPLDPALRPHTEHGVPTTRLREILERARKASRGIESGTVRALSIYQVDAPEAGWPLREWYSNYSSRGAVFRKGADRRFAGEFDEMMGGRPYRVGGDAEACWTVTKDLSVAVPARAIDVKDVSLFDPFDAGGTSSVDDLIRDRKLEYAGEVDWGGRRCHEIRSWNVQRLYKPRWFLDAETFLTARVESGPYSTIEYTYEGINQPVPDEAFRPPAQISRIADPGPLPDGYDRRFLSVRDGSDGHISVRWGMEGPEGRQIAGMR